MSNWKDERRSLEELEAAHRGMARDAFRAIDLLKEVFALDHLSTDVYTDSKELREKLYVRAGHAEGEWFGVENYLIPILLPLARYYEVACGWESRGVDLTREAEVRGILIATTSILDLIRRATGLDLWPDIPRELDPEELESYFEAD